MARRVLDAGAAASYDRTTTTASHPLARPPVAPRAQDRRSVGALLRDWRGRRRLSQLELAVQADVSTRHLSFIETGRSRPTRDMIIRLADHLDVPLRDRNTILLAAGHAPAYPVGRLDGTELATVLSALRGVLAGHEPCPALLVDRHWTLIEANRAVGLLTAGVAPALLDPPVNVLRLSLHPDGMAPRIVNLAEWRAHLLHRLHRQAATTGDADLLRLHEELAGYPGGEVETATDGVAVPLRFRLDRHELSLISFTAVLGTPLDVTLAELAVEAFLPADPVTADLLHARRAASSRR